MRILLSIAFIVLSISTFAQDIVCQPSDKQQIETLLKEARHQPKDTNWMMYFARQFFGVPYVGGTLDKGDEEKLIINLRQLDCTTYVETVLTLSMCAKNGEATFEDYCRHLRDVRYIDGEVSYVKRQHYFTVWMEDNVNQGIVRNIEGNNPPFAATQTLHIDYMSKHISSYKMLSAHKDWQPGIAAMEKKYEGRKYKYIPKSQLRPTKQNNTLLKKYINDGDIIAIITKKQGLDTTHIGIASWHKDGLHLINASSIHKKVVDEPMTFYDYMQKHPSQLGIRIVRMSK